MSKGENDNKYPDVSIQEEEDSRVTISLGER